MYNYKQKTCRHSHSHTVLEKSWTALTSVFPGLKWASPWGSPEHFISKQTEKKQKTMSVVKEQPWTFVSRLLYNVCDHLVQLFHVRYQCFNSKYLLIPIRYLLSSSVAEVIVSLFTACCTSWTFGVRYWIEQDCYFKVWSWKLSDQPWVSDQA